MTLDIFDGILILNCLHQYSFSMTDKFNPTPPDVASAGLSLEGRTTRLGEGQANEKPRNLEGKIAFVAGGSRGIGKAAIMEFARQGVPLVYEFSRGEAKDVVEEAAVYGSKVIVIQGDITKQDDVERAVATVKENKIKLDIAVMSTGITEDGMFEMGTWDQFNQVLQTNLVGPSMMLARLKRRMLFNEGASIIDIASTVGGEQENPGQGRYTASKAAFKAISQVLALEWADEGIRVNVLEPGFVDTELTKGLMANPELLGMITDLTALKRIAKPQDMAGVIAFLASDEAAYVTGAAFLVDGGLSRRASAAMVMREAGYRKVTEGTGWQQLDPDEERILVDFRNSRNQIRS